MILMSLGTVVDTPKLLSGGALAVGLACHDSEALAWSKSL
jgi:hypothetical protein